MDDAVPFASRPYLALLAALAFARGMDFLSTRIASPNLVLEGNPLARWLGWKRGVIVNLILVFILALWPLPAIVIVTSSTLVAARNFQNAWLMRTLGEAQYRDWHIDRILETPLSLYLFCLAGNTLLTAAVGGALMFFGEAHPITFAIGVGIIAYAAAVAFYTLLSVWRMRHGFRKL